MIGSLLVTPHKNALSTTSLLEVREVRKEAVGVCVDVVAVGRLHIPKIEQGRWHEARGVTAVRDETRGSEAQDEDAEAGEGGEGDVSGPTLLRVRRQLEARALEERTRREEPRGAEMEPRGAEMEPRWSRDGAEMEPRRGRLASGPRRLRGVCAPPRAGPFPEPSLNRLGLCPPGGCATSCVSSASTLPPRRRSRVYTARGACPTRLPPSRR